MHLNKFRGIQQQQGTVVKLEGCAKRTHHGLSAIGVWIFIIKTGGPRRKKMKRCLGHSNNTRKRSRIPAELALLFHCLSETSGGPECQRNRCQTARDVSKVFPVKADPQCVGDRGKHLLSFSHPPPASAPRGGLAGRKSQSRGGKNGGCKCRRCPVSLTLADSDHEASVAEEEQRSELKKSCNHEGRWMIAGLAGPLEEAEKIVRDSRSTTEVGCVRKFE